MRPDGPLVPAGPPSSDAVASTISHEMARIHSDSYGQANRVRTFVCEDLVVSLVDIELLPSEEVLVAAGRQDLVEMTHNEFEHSIRASFKAAVERATGRTVLSFMSRTHLNPHITIELFVLDSH